jgi:predicted transcriptional regulator
MTVEKRTKFQIYFDILEALSDELKNDSELQLTKIAHRANLPYDRFRSYLDYLAQLGMVSSEPDGGLAVTGKGAEYVQELRRNSEFLRRMGLMQ